MFDKNKSHKIRIRQEKPKKVRISKIINQSIFIIYILIKK